MLNLRINIILVIKRFFSIIVIPAIIFSCNNSADKTGKIKKEDQAAENKSGEQHKELIYLDTAEDIFTILCQGWALKDDEESLEGMDENSKFEIPYRSFYFSTGGTFIKNPRNVLDYGTWAFDEKTKIITINNTIDKGKDIYKIAKISADELVLVNVGIESITNLKFIGSGKRFRDPSKEPFYMENNRWRIKPTTTESDSAIHQRLKENLYFFVLFYKSILAKNDQYVSFWGLPSCFKWYGGGIFLKKEDELKANWINCFYNKEQAMKAYAMAGKLIRQKYNWPKGERNWLKLNLAVLEQMYKKIDEIH